MTDPPDGPDVDDEPAKADPSGRSAATGFLIGMVLALNAVLLFYFFWAMVTYSCHGRYECPV